MKKYIAASAVAAVVLSTTASASQPSVPSSDPPAVLTTSPAPMVVPAPPSSNAVLPQGTTIRLRTLTELHSQRNRTGDTFDLEVVEDVSVYGVVVIPRGSVATGQVTAVRKKGMWGRSGRLETRLMSVRANGATIPIRGSVGDRGQTGTAGVVASVAFLPVAGFFVTGTSAQLPVGTGFSAVTESDIPLILPPEAVAARPTVTILSPATQATIQSESPQAQGANPR